jgi:hypothetical protein
VAATPQTIMTGAQEDVDELRRLRGLLLELDRDEELEDALARVEDALIAAIGRGRAER